MLGRKATWVGGGESQEIAETLMPLLKALAPAMLTLQSQEVQHPCSGLSSSELGFCHGLKGPRMIQRPMES